MQTINSLRRAFKLGSAVVDEPVPGLPLETAQQILSATYPQARWTTLFETGGLMVGDTLQYEFLIPPVKTNG